MFVFLDHTNTPLDMYSQTNNHLCLPNILFVYLFSVPEEDMPVDFTRNKVVNNESLVHHDGHTWLQQRYNPRLFKDLTVTHGSCMALNVV